MPRGQREEFRPISLTKRRGDAARALAGIQAIDTQASSPSSCFSDSSVTSIEAAGPASSALCQIDKARPLRKASPISCAASGPFASRSTAARSVGAWSIPSGQSSGLRCVSRRVQAVNVDNGASLGRSRIQPSGSEAKRAESRHNAARRRSRDCESPRTTMSASAAAACPSGVVVVRTP